MMDATFAAVARLWEQHCSVREIARRVKISEAKVNKILLTIGAASSDDSKLLAAGLSVDEIAGRLGKSRKAVLARLPYSKGQYGWSTTNLYNIVTPAGLLLFYIVRPKQRDRRS